MWKSISLLYVFIHCTFCVEVAPISWSTQALFPSSLTWDAQKQSIYFVDPFGFQSNTLIIRHDSNTNQFYTATVASNITVPLQSMVQTNKENTFVCDCDLGLCLIEWNGISPSAKFVKQLAQPDDPSQTIAIARTAPDGRLFLGRASRNCDIKNGTVLSYLPDSGLQKILVGAGTFSDIAFDNENAYFVQSCEQVITVFNRDSESNICSGRVLVDFKKLGLFVTYVASDTGNFLYVSSSTSTDNEIWRVHKSTGAAEKIVSMPIRIGALAFGGSTLYVVSLFDTPGPSLYQITGLDAEGFPISLANIE